jgi:tRNA (cmo5U34)-methyltransferase
MQQNGIDASHWDEQNSTSFLELGKYFVPDREAQLEYFRNLIPAAPAHIVELGCGEGLLARVLLEAFPDARVHGLDGSATMLARSRNALAGFGQRFEGTEFELAGRAWRQFPWPLDACVSSLVIHHLDGDGKRALFKDIAAALAPGGVFLIADLVMPKSPLAIKLAARAWDDAVRQRSLELAGNLDPFEEFHASQWNYYVDPESDPVDHPSPIYEQLRWLEDAGLTDVDVFWMRAGHALFGGRKAES